MRRTDPTCSFLLFLFLAVFALCGQALAQQQDTPYIVRDVKVDITAASAVKARDKAFGEAQMKAFEVLAGRFMMPEEVVTFQKPDAKTVAGLVQDFEIVSEQLSTKRYIGTYIFRFKEGATDRFFGHAPVVGYGEGVRGGLLVLPYYQENENQYLWDSKNIWFKAWTRAQDRVGEDIIIPLGDVSDLMDMQNGQATTYNPAALKRMKKRYGASDAVVALATLQPNSPSQPLQIKLYRTDLKEPEVGSTIVISAGGVTDADKVLDQAVQETLVALQDSWKAEAQAPTTLHDGLPQDPEAVPADSGYDAPLAYPGLPRALQPDGAQIATTPAAQPNTALRTSVRFADMAQWISMRRNLNGIPGLAGVKIISLNRTEAVVDLNYHGTADVLKAQLGARGVAFNQAGGTYTMSATPTMR